MSREDPNPRRRMEKTESEAYKELMEILKMNAEVEEESSPVAEKEQQTKAEAQTQGKFDLLDITLPELFDSYSTQQVAGIG